MKKLSKKSAAKKSVITFPSRFRNVHQVYYWVRRALLERTFGCRLNARRRDLTRRIAGFYKSLTVGTTWQTAKKAARAIIERSEKLLAKKLRIIAVPMQTAPAVLLRDPNPLCLTVEQELQLRLHQATIADQELRLRIHEAMAGGHASLPVHPARPSGAAIGYASA